MKEYNKTVIDCVLGQRLSNGYVAQTLWLWATDPFSGQTKQLLASGTVDCTICTEQKRIHTFYSSWGRPLV